MKCEMGNGKCDKRAGAECGEWERGRGGSKKKGKTYYVCYYNAISFVFLFGLRFALL